MSNPLLHEAMLCDTQDHADALLARMEADLLSRNPNMTQAEASYQLRRSIGYLAGRYSHEARARVEKLFKTAHPILGSIRFNGPPSAQQAMQLGVEYGRATREMREGKIKDAYITIAKIPRVDIRRVPCQRVTGITTNALDETGHYNEVDISMLTCDSLIRYVQSRGGRNVFAEGLVLRLLGHELPEHMAAPSRPSTTKDR